MVPYASGSGEDYIAAYAVVDNVGVDTVVITLKTILEKGPKVDHARNEQITVNPEDLTLRE